ncbi:DUF5793 family protein [Halopenitus salinus]|uniref:DUF5793 family protein n=1 Tax=Halopenitus salinus TaxID=1198295 RepID=A0ABD5UWS2_9EURY
MRRDHFELTVEGVERDGGDGDPRKPFVRIDFHGPEGLLTDRLTGPDGDLLAAEETDVAFRLREPIEDESATGVVAVTNRVTGEFVLELNEAAEDVLGFIRAAREYGRATDDDEEGRYRVEIAIDGEVLVTYDKRTFLVYDPDGNLLRGESLIPSGVEL